MSEDQVSAIKNIKTLSDSREKVTKFFNNYSKIASRAKYISIYGEGLDISSSKQMLQRLPIAFAQVKTGNTNENLQNEIRKTTYFLYWAKKSIKKVYNNIMNLINL